MLRRDFLQSGLSGLAAAAAWPAWAQAVEQATDSPALGIVDTHTHFYDPARPQGVPWPNRNDPLLYRSVLPAEYQKLARPLDIVGTVVVEASAWVEDNQWLLNLAEKEPFLVGIVGRLDPAADDFATQLRRFAQQSRFRGLRLSQQQVAASLEAEGIARLKLLVDLNLELDINGGPEMPALAARLAEKLPELRIVLNHAANVRIDGREPPVAWFDGMQAAAKNPQVYCKVSGLVEKAEQRPSPRSVDYYRPVLDALWKLFGEDRLIFGSNWPVSAKAAPLDAVVAIVRDYFGARGRKASVKFFSGNAQVAYAWPVQ